MKERLGQFTSSEVWKLMSGTFGLTELQKKTLADFEARISEGVKPLTEKQQSDYTALKEKANNKDFSQQGKSYIEAKNFERMIGRSLNTEIFSRPISWGNYFEGYAYERLDLSWNLVSKTRWTHPTLPWSGMPDIICGDKIGDIKSPYTLISFCQQYSCFGDVEKYKKDFPEYYWQLVSNAILCDVKSVTAVIFVPKLSDFAEIKEDILTPGKYEKDYSWIATAKPSEVPYLPDDCLINSLQTWEFEVPDSDRAELVERISVAASMLK